MISLLLAFLGGFLFVLLCVRLLIVYLKRVGRMIWRKNADGSVDIFIA